MGKFNNKQIKIGVLRGGQGEDYNYGVKEGSQIISYITENYYPKYKPIDIFVDRYGIWHISGIKSSPIDLIHKVDLIWNTASPSVYQIIKNFSIPVIGHGAFSSVIKNNKDFLKEHMKMIDVKVPKSILFGAYNEDIDGDLDEYVVKKAKEVHAKFSPPYTVKSFNPDLDEGIYVVKTFPELIEKIKEIFLRKDSVLVEELIGGQNVSMHLLKDFRGEGLYHFPLIDKIRKEEKEKLHILAKDIHKHLANKNYLKLDFIIHPNLGIYLNNINFTLNLTSDLHLEESIQSVGAKKRHIFEHIIDQVL